MFMEIAQIPIKAGKEAGFEAAIRQAKPRFLKLKGCQEFELRRSVETPGRYYLLIKWATLEDHTVGFRNSELDREIRPLLVSFLDGAPMVEHGRLVPL